MSGAIILLPGLLTVDCAGILVAAYDDDVQEVSRGTKDADDLAPRSCGQNRS